MQNLNIYEINTLTWLQRLATKYKRDITLANVPDEDWDAVASYGCNTVWLMGVWQRSDAAIGVNRNDASFAPEMQEVLTDFNFDKDVIGSAYSIRDYTVSSVLGGNEALAIAREQLKKRSLKLLLDFVPNHVAPDHEWVTEHPEYFMLASDEEYVKRPHECMQINGSNFALGRDPYGAPWSDVLQLHAFSTELRARASHTLLSIARQCDGVRCDMAMLMTNDIFKNTWQSLISDVPQTEYWSDLITAIRSRYPEFLFIAEAYWGTQETLLDQGFDYCYNKDFYDALRDNDVESLKTLFAQPVAIQQRQVRFLENHDEPRIASILDYKQHTAAAILLATSPSARMYFDGQFDGIIIRTPVQLGRDPSLDPNEQIQQFYSKYSNLLKNIPCNQTSWQPCSVTAVTHSADATHEAVFAWKWQIADTYYLAVTNFSKQSTEVLVACQWTDVDMLNAQLTVLFSNSSDNSALAKTSEGLECRLHAYDAMIVSIRPAI